MLIETPTAVVELREDGVVCVRILPGVQQNLEEAEANLLACERACAGRRRPLLVDMREAAPLEADTRHLYAGRRLENWFRAVGLIIKATPLGRMMGNVYLRSTRLAVPVRLFEDGAAANAWLVPFAGEPSDGL